MSLNFAPILAIAFAMVASPFARAEARPQHADAEPVIPLIRLSGDKSLPIEDIDGKVDIPARTVFFELNPVTSASAYNIQVKALTQHWAEPYTTAIEGTTLRLRLTPGRYKMRTRSKNDKDQPGRWGHWQEFWVHFRSPTGIFPSDRLTIIPKGNNAERVTFEWPAEKGARFYVFSLYDGSGNMMKHFRTSQTWVPVDLELGKAYAWTVVPLTSKDEPEPPSEQTHQFQVSVPNTELRQVQVQIEPRKSALSYDFEFLKFISDHQTGEATIQNSKEANYRAALSPGEYEMRARTNYDDGSHSNWTPPQRFWVRVANPQHLSPVNNAKVDPTDDNEAKVKLKWQPAKEAKRYHVFVWDEKDKLIEDQETESHTLTLSLPHQRKYKWSVTALQDREKGRGPASIANAPPDDTTSFEIDKYKRLDLNAAEEPSQVYAWGRYLTSNISYKANNYDNNTQISENVFGGTGELAAGYWHRKSDFGLLAAASASGFRTEGKVYTYNYGSLLLGYRLKSEASANRWRFWAGMAYKETPEILKNPDDGVYFSKNAAFAPETRIAYLGEFNKKYGYQLYGSYLTEVSSVHTVNGQPLRSLYQLNLGAYATYRFSEDMVAMAGYSYQIDAASYQSNDELTHGINDLSFAGHYLSLTLQIGLEKAQH
jgi:hypothetical protein